MSQEQIQQLALDKIECDRQVRGQFDEDALDGLATSLAEDGLLQPIRVRRSGPKFIVVDGERRLRGAHRLGWKTIGAIIEEKDLCEGEVIQRQLVANCQREDLLPLEKARAIQRLMEATGWPAAQAAAKVKLSNASVSKLLALLALPEGIQHGIDAGVIPVSAGYDLSRIADPAKQADAAQQLIDGRLTRDALSGAVRAKINGVGDAAVGKPQTKRVTARLAGGRAVTIVCPALDLERFIEVLEELLSKARRGRATGGGLATLTKLWREQSETG